MLMLFYSTKYKMRSPLLDLVNAKATWEGLRKSICPLRHPSVNFLELISQTPCTRYVFGCVF